VVLTADGLLDKGLVDPRPSHLDPIAVLVETERVRGPLGKVVAANRDVVRNWDAVLLRYGERQRGR
jgi:hypothetical protein